MAVDEPRTQTRLTDLVAEELRALLARRRISGRELARQLEESPSWVNYRLTGHTPIGLNDMQRIAEALGVGLVDLLPSHARHGSIAQTIRRPERPRRAAVRTMVPATAERLTARVPTTQPETSQRATRLAVA